jgi:hypothetical protein
VDGASKKKNFSFIDVRNSDLSEVFHELDPERKAVRSKTELPPEKFSKIERSAEKSSTILDKFEDESEKNLMSIKKDYEKTIVSRDLDQSLSEISNIKIVQNTFSNCNISVMDETLHLSEKVPILTKEVKFPKEDLMISEDLKISENPKISEPSLKLKHNFISMNNEDQMKKPKKKGFAVSTPSINNHLFRSLVFSPVISDTSFKAHLLNTYKGLVYAKRFLKPPSNEFLREKMVTLPEIKGF